MTLDFLTNGPDDGPILILAHGAGAPMDNAWMERFAWGFAKEGLRVLRFEFPYMAKRRTAGSRGAPDREPVLLQTWRDAIEQAGGASEVVIGGKSMGGRMASMVADEAGVRGLVCLGYPFHPPGRPEKTRTAHLKDLRTPALIVQGTRDPFGTRDDVAGYDLSPAIRIHWIEDADHDLKSRAKVTGRSATADWDDAITTAAAFIHNLPR